MNNVLDAMKERRSIRQFKPDAISQDLIDQIIEAGLYAASARGMQNTIIIQVTNKNIRNELSELNRKFLGWEEDEDPFHGAPAILVVLGKKGRLNPVYEGSLVMGNLLLAAHGLGLGSCWIHRAKEEFETEWGKKLLKSLAIEEEYEGIAHCAIGYVDGDYPEAPPRKENRVFHIKEN